MRTKAWAALAIVTLVVVAVAIYTVVARHSATTEQVASGVLFPDLMGRINEVATLSYVKGKDRWTMTRGPDGWVMVEKHGYRVSADLVKKIAVALADLKIIEAKTNRPELYGKIGVDDIDKEGSEAVLVELRDKADAPLAALLVGKSRTHESTTAPGKVYVRKPGEARAWLVEARLLVPPNPLTWLNKEVVKLAKGRVDRVVINHPDGELVVVERGDDRVDYFKLRDLPEGQKLHSTQRVGAMAAGLEFIGFTDVAPAASKGFEGKAVVAELETHDGLRVIVEILPEPDADDSHWARLRAEYDGSLVRQLNTGKKQEDGADGAQNENKNEDKTEPEVEDKAEQVRAEAARITELAEGWAYLVPSYRAENLLRRMADLTQPAEPEKQDD